MGSHSKKISYLQKTMINKQCLLYFPTTTALLSFLIHVGKYLQNDKVVCTSYLVEISAPL